jgi:predicted nucleotidyltransferase component of viral defense system
MIPQAFITDWRNKAPWHTNEQIEQDLIISRSLAEIYSDPLLSDMLAFRGGTALHKIFLPSPMRYSEDIDLVQVYPGPIGRIFDSIRKRLAFLGKPRVIQKDRNNVMVFLLQSTIPPVIPLKLKIEINCREHVNIHGAERKNFVVDSPWFKGECSVQTYSIEELLGSKIRALYQRRKGRDLFDLWYALEHVQININKTIEAFSAFMNHCGTRASANEYLRNMEAKMQNTEFRNDTKALIRPEINFDIDAAWRLVRDKLIALLP